MGYDKNKAITKANELLLKNFVDTPPVNITQLASNEGLRVQYATFTDDEVAGFLNPEKKIIYVNHNDSAVRQAFTVAHELGHWVLHKSEIQNNPDKYAVLFRRAIGEPNEDSLEKEANCFAASLLVPKDMLEKYKKQAVISLKDGDVIDTAYLADVFAVSKDVIGYRLKNEFGF